jgi:hypothetical protein
MRLTILNSNQKKRIKSREKNLTGDATAPYVQALGATMTADETLRIQAVLDLRTDRLLVSLSKSWSIQQQKRAKKNDTDKK